MKFSISSKGDSIVSGTGKDGNNRRRPFKRRDREDNWSRDSKKRGEAPRYDKNKGTIFERPKWTPPKASVDSLPQLDCQYCGNPIKDISLAITDKTSGNPVHFDCMITKLSESELLEKGDIITYIGSGRFAIVHFDNPHDHRKFKIKKVFECEEKDIRADWRKNMADRYSTT